MFPPLKLRTQNTLELGLPRVWQNLCAEADIHGARLSAEMNSE
jgi:hypothetical protein